MQSSWTGQICTLSSSYSRRKILPLITSTKVYWMAKSLNCQNENILPMKFWLNLALWNFSLQYIGYCAPLTILKFFPHVPSVLLIYFSTFCSYFDVDQVCSNLIYQGSFFAKKVTFFLSSRR